MQPSFPSPQSYGQSPPPYQAPPASGFRIPLNTDQPIPSVDVLGRPVGYDADGRSPIFIGSAIFQNSVHPCKIGPHLSPPCRVPYGGGEHEHRGRYDLLPFDPVTMEWVHTSGGRIPPGRRAVQGGYEENGTRLYHALANIGGIRVPGKTGEHLVVAATAHSAAENMWNGITMKSYAGNDYDAV
ncbi:uncharacterized protein FIBRA_02124 [Fibroporia radiculosa]|uniref:Uncharacterized protein n=1 Tax=Fibroporia radiculosa TaxID=599839 RepID=J4HUE4_9APHY|nr:uncharacterized protein FIBRA_02124 [Fibroporia radiculosa]CCM00097.1 predicted protein [Fibroporia radiculosa]